MNVECGNRETRDGNEVLLWIWIEMEIISWNERVTGNSKSFPHTYSIVNSTFPVVA